MLFKGHQKTELCSKDYCPSEFRALFNRIKVVTNIVFLQNSYHPNVCEHILIFFLVSSKPLEIHQEVHSHRPEGGIEPLRR